MTVRAGRYETLHEIAAGGMATVYLGRAVGLGGFERLVAIKVMHPHLAHDPEFVTMFLDEARLAARIHHPNVVSTIDVQEGDGGLLIVMDYVEGPSLLGVRKALSKLGKTMPLEVVVRVASDMLSGLHAAHELEGPDGKLLDLVHRDVSPANVLIGVDGVARITDFGVARATWRLSTTRDGRVKGKLAYMPPEQIRGERVDRRCDVYAAGMVMWEMLAGERPFAADNDGALLAAILGGVSSGPRAIRPTVPTAIDEVCMRALAVDARDRFATAADFAEALERAAACEHLAIATSRGVSAFVKELAVHRSREELIAGMRTTTQIDADGPTTHRSDAGGGGGTEPIASVRERWEKTERTDPSEGSVGLETRATERVVRPADSASHAAATEDQPNVARVGAPTAASAEAAERPSAVSTSTNTAALLAVPPSRPRRSGWMIGAAVAVLSGVLAVGFTLGRTAQTNPAALPNGVDATETTEQSGTSVPTARAATPTASTSASELPTATAPSSPAPIASVSNAPILALPSATMGAGSTPKPKPSATRPDVARPSQPPPTPPPNPTPTLPREL